MAKVHGKDTVFTLGATVLTGQLNSVDFPRSAAASDATTFGVGAEEFTPGLESGTITLTGFFDATTASTIAGMNGTIQTFEYGPAGDATGKPKSSGDCIVTGVNVNGSVRENVGLTITCTVTGPVVDGTFA